MGRMKHLLHKLLLMVILLLLISCKKNDRDTMAALHQISNSAEIMYTEGLGEIAAVNHDGSQKQVFLPNHRFISPDWSSDGQTFFGLSGVMPYYPAYWDLQTDQYKVCKEALNQDAIEWANNPDEPYEVLIQDFKKIIRYNIETCEEIETVINLRYPSTLQHEINGFSYFATTNEIVYSKNLPTGNGYESEYRIIKKTIGKSEETTLAQGINPKWSPDGAMISFIGADGVYVMDADGGNQRLLWRYDFGAGWNWQIRSTEKNDAVPNWSPDGKWLVFHIKNDENGEMLDAMPVYCLSVIDGAIQKIADDGEYPVWIPGQ